MADTEDIALRVHQNPPDDRDHEPATSSRSFFVHLIDFGKHWRWHCIGLVVIMYIIPLILGIVAIPVFKCHQTSTVLPCTESTTSSDSTAGTTVQPKNESLRIITRSEWGAEAPKTELPSLTLPVNRVIIAHTATDICLTMESCVQRIRLLQQYHMVIDALDDIAFNFLFGGDGSVYEGRGFLKVGDFLKGQDTISLGIAFVGDYKHTAPAKQQMDSLESLLKYSKKNGILRQDYKLFGALQLQTTESPGRLLYEELKKLPHWSDDIV